MNRKAIQAYNAEIEKQMRQNIQKLLSDNKMSYDFDIDSQGFIEITIIDGDWKHDHIALKNVMREAGYFPFGRTIIGADNGDDSFSAIYKFR